MQRKLHSSSLNLHTSREPQASYPPSISEETDQERDSAGRFTSENTVPRRLHKAQSLNVLSETWSQTQIERDATTADGRTRSMSNTSAESSLSGFSSSSESSSSLNEEEQTQSRPADQANSSSPDPNLSDRRGSDISTESSGSVSLKGSETVSVAPRVPPRPKTEEILTRCTTMTRKAALATKAQLQIQPEPIYTR